jgi:L-amino acid N-acyltransferase YncA
MPETRIAEVLKNYPLQVELNNHPFTVRPMTPDDGPEMLAFASELPQHDILFMRRDITTQKGINKWVRDLEGGTIYSILAEDAHGICGYSTIHRNDLEWSQHVAEVRVTTSERARGYGLGRLLTREAFNIALSLGIEKLVARMTTDQTAARELFHELGFHNEALLKDHVKDRNGELHDLLLMACDVQMFLSTRNAYGVVN